VFPVLDRRALQDLPRLGLLDRSVALFVGSCHGTDLFGHLHKTAKTSEREVVLSWRTDRAAPRFAAVRHFPLTEGDLVAVPLLRVEVVEWLLEERGLVLRRAEKGMVSRPFLRCFY
jgi:hypothetical protein